MQQYFADLHIHIGRTKSGKPVKITGAKSLTIEAILHYATEVKGLDIIGVIDCHVPEVLKELEELIIEGKVYEDEFGGLRFKEVTLLLGAEIEIYDNYCQGPIHVLAFIPTIDKMWQFSSWLAKRMKNITLSSQRIYEEGRALQQIVKELEGLFIPAHVFTPHKSLYGKGVKSSLKEVFDEAKIDAIELGLSSDTHMADQISELHSYPFLSNSDAHSLAKIAREYQKIELKAPTFAELAKALKGTHDRRIVANYGLDPLLGKYHRTTCEKCFSLNEHTLTGACTRCGHKGFIKGVYERLNELKNTHKRNIARPPYIHQVPLEFIPGLGPKTLQKLRDYFQTEMAIIHHVPKEALVSVVGEKIADLIIRARLGTLDLQSGGGGQYGKVKNSWNS